jgi:hypothetical protein
MTIERTIHQRVICESCNQYFGGTDEFTEAVAVRRAALAAGWQLVPKVRTNGKDCHVDLSNDRAVALASSVAHDVCPACLPEFLAGRARKTSGRTGDGGSWIRRMQARLAALEEENTRLKGGRP